MITATAAITLAACTTSGQLAAGSGQVSARRSPPAARSHAVVTYTVNWFDASRNRTVPARIYAPADLTGPAPVIVFSHGLGNSMNGYAFLGEQWASEGFISVHPDHGGVRERDLLHLWLVGFDRRLRYLIPGDDRFVIDQLNRDDVLPPALRGKLDLAHIGVAGHSLGAYAALALAGLRVVDADFHDPRVRAGVEMSMSENFPPSAYRNIDIPMLHLTGTRDMSLLYGTLPYKRRIPFESIPHSDQYLVVIPGATHATFAEKNDVVLRDTTLFWDAYLRGDAAARTQLASVAQTKNGTPRIGKIEVKTTPVFSAAEAQQGGFYRAVDVLAVKTPETLVRKFLLFHEGEPFDQSRLTESERNLRTLDFLMSASVKASEPHDGVVDVVVETQDAWTTTPNVDFSNDGGRSLYDISVTQMDLFGTGADVIARTAEGRERRTSSLEVLHPALFGAYTGGDVLYARSSDGNEERIAVQRPLYAHDTPRTFSVSFDHLLQDTRFYALGTVQSLFRQEHREATLAYGSRLFATEKGSMRLLFGADVLSDSFTLRHGVAPDDRHFRFLEAGADTTAFDYVKLDHVDYGLREQDFNLGMHGALVGGWSPPVHGHGVVWRVRGDASDGIALGPHTIAITQLTATSRFGDVNHNVILSSDSHFIARFGTRWPQAFVARLRLDHGSDLDRDIQFFADGQNGLRAYPNFAFTGANRQVLNAEQRIFLGRELMQVLEPGAALFLDTGRAGGGPLRTDLGAGIRFGIARWNQAMLRFDLAYALNDSPLSRRGLVFSFATTQAF